MTAGWLKAQLEMGEWHPSPAERAAAAQLLTLLSQDVEDGSLAAKRLLATQTVATLREFMRTWGTKLYRSERASLYSILGALIIQLSPLRTPQGTEPPAGYSDSDLRGRLIDAELSIGELKELLRAAANPPINGRPDHA